MTLAFGGSEGTLSNKWKEPGEASLGKMKPMVWAPLKQVFSVYLEENLMNENCGENESSLVYLEVQSSVFSSDRISHVLLLMLFLFFKKQSKKKRLSYAPTQSPRCSSPRSTVLHIPCFPPALALVPGTLGTQWWALDHEQRVPGAGSF